jgi:hypothetical protein
VVGRAHHLLVVLDDEHRIPEVAQPLERPDQLRVVALVQADRGLVEDVEDADELRADLGREPQPLRLAPGERGRGAVELEVADADVVEKGRAPIKRSVSLSSRPSRNSIARVTDMALNSWIALPPTVTASTSGFSRAPLQTGHGRKLMYSSIRSRCCEESVSL